MTAGHFREGKTFNCRQKQSDNRELSYVEIRQCFLRRRLLPWFYPEITGFRAFFRWWIAILTSEISKLIFCHREPKRQRRRILSFCKELQEKQALPVNCCQIALRMVEKGISSRPQVGDFQVAIRG
jgi:hypothetical protein